MALVLCVPLSMPRKYMMLCLRDVGWEKARHHRQRQGGGANAKANAAARTISPPYIANFYFQFYFAKFRP
jgi:hypothetical protein